MIEQLTPNKSARSSKRSPTPPITCSQDDCLARLLTAAKSNPKEVKDFRSHRNEHMQALMRPLGHTSTPSHATYNVLANIAFRLARGERILTANSGAYHARGSEEPTAALIFLQKIVTAAGFPCSIATQANIKLEKQSGEISATLKKIGALPVGGCKTFFSISGPSFEAARSVLEGLQTRGVSIELWPALVAH